VRLLSGIVLSREGSRNNLDVRVKTINGNAFEYMRESSNTTTPSACLPQRLNTIAFRTCKKFCCFWKEISRLVPCPWKVKKRHKMGATK